MSCLVWKHLNVCCISCERGRVWVVGEPCPLASALRGPCLPAHRPPPLRLGRGASPPIYREGRLLAIFMPA